MPHKGSLLPSSNHTHRERERVRERERERHTHTHAGGQRAPMEELGARDEGGSCILDAVRYTRACDAL